MSRYFGPQPPQSWLFSIEEELPAAKPGASYDLWSEPPRDDATGDILLRADGIPYTPKWTTGDDIFIHHPESGRCVAFVEVTGPPVWNETEEWFDVSCTMRRWAGERGPLLDSVGIKPVQGGRKRLDPDQSASLLKGMP